MSRYGAMASCTRSAHHGAHPASEDCPWCEPLEADIPTLRALQVGGTVTMQHWVAATHDAPGRWIDV